MISSEQIRGLQRRGRKFADLLRLAEAGAKTKDQNVLQRELETLQAQINSASKKIPTLSADEKKKKISQLKPVSDRITELKRKIDKDAPLFLPNIPKDDVPEGDDETANVVLREVGIKPDIVAPRDYLSIAEDLGLIDIRRAGKVSGSRFGYILGPLAQMEFALVQLAQSIILKEKFTMVVPPVLIREENMEAMGYLSGGGENETYHFEKDGLYLVGTSEQSIGPMHKDEVFSATNLPKRYLAFSTCFRREAGSYGKDTKGIIRVHQFDKLEMFSITSPEHGDTEHEFLLSLQERLMQRLGLPYRVVQLSTGDLGWPSARTYDIDTWMPGQGVYRETHSTSTTTDYQSRALNIRFERKGKKDFVHMLNGTAFAIGRTLVAIIENYQQPDGSIEIPKALRPWMDGLDRIKK